LIFKVEIKSLSEENVKLGVFLDSALQSS